MNLDACLSVELSLSTMPQRNQNVMQYVSNDISYETEWEVKLSLTFGVKNRDSHMPLVEILLFLLSETPDSL